MDELDAAIAKDKADLAEARSAAANEPAPTSVTTEQEPVEKTDPEPTEQVDQVEEPEEEKEEPVEEEEDENEKRIARLAYKSRESDRQLKAAQFEIARLKGERTETYDEQVTRLANERATQISAANTFNAECNKVADAGKKEFPNFDKNINAMWETLGGFHAPLVEATIEAADSDPKISAKILNYLGKNTDIAEDIAKMTPAKQAVAITKIAAKLDAPKPVSKAPPPMKTVAGNAKTTKPPLDLANGPIKEVMEYWDRQAIERRKNRR